AGAWLIWANPQDMTEVYEPKSIPELLRELGPDPSETLRVHALQGHFEEAGLGAIEHGLVHYLVHASESTNARKELAEWFKRPDASFDSAIEYVPPESPWEGLENADRRLGAALGIPPASAT